MVNESLFTNSQTVKSSRVLYTASEFAKNNLIYLQEAGQLTALRQHTSKRQKLKSYLFFIVTHGAGKFTYEDETYDLTEGSCVFIDCHKKYSHETSGDYLWHLTWAHFYGDLMESIYAEYLSNGAKPVFHTKHESEYILLIERIMDEVRNVENSRDMLLFQELTTLITKIMMESSAAFHSDQTTTQAKLFNIREHLNKHYKDKIALDDLEREFHVNKYYLTRIFKQQFGTTVANYLIQQRITNAKYLLRFSDKTIEDIGYSCGVNDPSYFNRMFKKIEGVSPSEFRSIWSESSEKAEENE